MHRGNILSVFIMFCVRWTWSDSRFVTYTIVSQATSPGPGRQACAEAYADNEYFAARIHDVTGVCEGLKWSWGSTKQYESGYSYLNKLKTVEIYQPSVDVAASTFQWLIPGTFDVGGSLEFYMTTPAGNWDGFEVNLLDTADGNYDVYSGESETIMMHIKVVKNHNELAFKTWVSYWSNKLSIPIPFSDGSITKFSIVPHSNVLQVLINDEPMVEYTHPVHPSTAKLFTIGCYSNTDISIHNITFIGV